MNFGHFTGVWAFVADVLDSVLYQIYQGRGGKVDALENWLRAEWERDALERSLQPNLVDGPT